MEIRAHLTAILASVTMLAVTYATRPRGEDVRISSMAREGHSYTLFTDDGEFMINSFHLAAHVRTQAFFTRKLYVTYVGMDLPSIGIKRTIIDTE